MAKKLYASVSGQTKEVKKLYCSVGGQTKKVKKLYASVNGQTKQVFPGYGTPTVATIVVDSSTTNVVPIAYYQNKVNPIIVDWGDGSAETTTTTGLKELTHTYSADGTYDITITPESNALFRLGNAGNYKGFINASSGTPAKKLLRSIVLGSNMDSTMSRTFSDDVELNCDIVFPEGITTIGPYVLYYNKKFNGNIILPSTLITLDYFLYGMDVYNKPITIPNGTTTCSGFQDMPLFNSDFSIPDTVTNVGSGFLSYCPLFNKSINVSKVQNIGYYFLNHSKAFNQPLDISSATQINFNFMTGCIGFNQPITLSNSLTTVGYSFMQSCTSFNQDISFPSSSNINPYGFMYSCTSMTSNITFNGTIAPVSNYWNGFLVNTPCSITVNTSSVPSDTNTSNPPISHTTSYDTWLTGTNAEAWKNALPALPDATYPSYYRNLRIA